MKTTDLVQTFYDWYRNTLRNTKYRWLIVLGTLLYLLSPIDISPDFLPIIGWIDDGIVAALLVSEMSQILLEQLNRRNKRQATAPTDAAASEAVNPKTIDIDAQQAG
ncbi:MAG: YkvA family protein [Synechococcales bacterium]|nr:YkvA family protein [Synechococcales bacterium]